MYFQSINLGYLMNCIFRSFVVDDDGGSKCIAPIVFIFAHSTATIQVNQCTVGWRDGMFKEYFLATLLLWKCIKMLWTAMEESIEWD